MINTHISYQFTILFLYLRLEMSKIVETELLRKKLYECKILGLLTEKLPQLRYKEVCHIALRYIFNKNITKQKDDDPVFITTKSHIAETQLRKDFVYSKINSISCDELISELEKAILYCSHSIKHASIKNDRSIILFDGFIEYGTWKYKDISNLGKRYPSSLKYALALNIRYTYLKLLNHGLARTFDTMGYKSSDSTEGFASAFNHYFDRFCSAFPDLEAPFGSMGSFFDNNSWTTDIVFVNPPFDECLMTHAIKRVYEYLETTKDDRKFLFTLPNWENYPELEDLKRSKWTTFSHVYKKGELPFIDYMKDKSIVYPCDIAEIVLEKKNDM